MKWTSSLRYVSAVHAAVSRCASLATRPQKKDIASSLQAGRQSLTARSAWAVDFAGLDLVVLENVGNLVCPAEFDTGAAIDATILSVPEGDDKPLKYPLMYEKCDILVISKTDVLPYFDFDTEKVMQNARMRNPEIEVMFVSAKTGEGMDELADWIIRRVKEWN